MIGLSGTVKVWSGLTVILRPSGGTTTCSYFIRQLYRQCAGREGSGALVCPAGLAALGDEHGELQGLLVVQARIDRRAVGPGEVRIREATRAARAFRDVIPGQLDVHATEVRAHLGMNAKGGIELMQDVLEAARLQASGAGLGVAVHGIADPEDGLSGLAHGFDGLRQRRGDVLRAEAV